MNEAASSCCVCVQEVYSCCRRIEPCWSSSLSLSKQMTSFFIIAGGIPIVSAAHTLICPCQAKHMKCLCDENIGRRSQSKSRFLFVQQEVCFIYNGIANKQVLANIFVIKAFYLFSLQVTIQLLFFPFDK